MNSEELEVSLKTEFESHLKNVFAEMRQEISQLQTKIETELENHKQQLAGVFSEAANRVNKSGEVDEGFRESVVEHLRLARDEGARITATAIAEAEEMQKQAAPAVGVKELNQAVSDISTKSSQAEILKTLVQHAGQFTPRGAFFIVKNDHFVGWRTFGNEVGDAAEPVREVFLPVSSDSILGESVRSLTVVESSAGTYTEDADVLSKLDFEGSPAQMYAIPLVVRGRAVALLYADYGNKGAEVNLEGLEAMVCVAGLTVELLASSKGVSRAKSSSRKSVKSFAGESFAPAETGTREPSPEYAGVASFNSAPVETNHQNSFESSNYAAPTDYQPEARSFDDYQPADSYQPAADSEYSVEPEVVNDYSSANDYSPASENSFQYSPEPAVSAPESSYQESSWDTGAGESVSEINANDYVTEIDADSYSSPAPEVQTDDYAKDFSFQPTPAPETAADDYFASSNNDYQIESNQSYGATIDNSASAFDSATPESYSSPVENQYEQPPVQVETSYDQSTAAESSFAAPVESQPEPVAEPTPPVAPPPVRSRFSERNVDLPIEVSEDERRLHNDARRFARLLVSEIKLYNEQKVKEGRDAGDLYDRLREAIDRSREMYDKRVQAPVAAKFDYFNYELVNTLAEGDANKLGADYPGSSV